MHPVLLFLPVTSGLCWLCPYILRLYPHFASVQWLVYPYAGWLCYAFGDDISGTVSYVPHFCCFFCCLHHFASCYIPVSQQFPQVLTLLEIFGGTAERRRLRDARVRTRPSNSLSELRQCSPLVGRSHFATQEETIRNSQIFIGTHQKWGCPQFGKRIWHACGMWKYSVFFAVLG